MDDEIETMTWAEWAYASIDNLVASADCFACYLMRMSASRIELLESMVKSNQPIHLIEAHAKLARESVRDAEAAIHTCANVEHRVS